MPWGAAEFKKFKKGLSDKSASKAASIANQILSETGDKRKAIRVANSQVRPSFQRKLEKLKAKNKKGVPGG